MISVMLAISHVVMLSRMAQSSFKTLNYIILQTYCYRLQLQTYCYMLITNLLLHECTTE